VADQDGGGLPDKCFIADGHPFHSKRPLLNVKDRRRHGTAVQQGLATGSQNNNGYCNDHRKKKAGGSA